MSYRESIQTALRSHKLVDKILIPLATNIRGSPTNFLFTNKNYFDIMGRAFARTNPSGSSLQKTIFKKV